MKRIQTSIQVLDYWRNVHFALGTKSIEVNSLYLLSLVSIAQIFRFLGSVLSLKIVFDPRFVAMKKELFWTPAANQIAGNKKYHWACTNKKIKRDIFVYRNRIRIIFKFLLRLWII